MSLRESIEKRPGVTAGVVGGILLASAVWFIYVLKPEATPSLDKAFYTDDDGKTMFVDSIDRVPPFDHNGKVAVRAMVYTIDDHRTSFIGFLERYTPSAAKQLNASQAAVAAGKPATADRAQPSFAIGGTEFKKPGEASWTPSTDVRARQNLFKGIAKPGVAFDSVLP